MSVTLQATSPNTEAPVEAQVLQELMQKESGRLQDKKDFIRVITSRLSEVSSKYKYLVEVISVTTEETLGGSFEVSSSVGTVWDNGRDGFYTFKIETPHVYLANVYWIYVD